jgi:mRNA interferase HicA
VPVSPLLLQVGLLPRRRQIRATAVRHLRRHANALAQHRVWVNRLANVHRIRTHLDGQGNLANHVARMRANHAAAKNLAVAMGFGAVVKQQLGDTLVAAVGNGTARRHPSVCLEINNIFVIFSLLKTTFLFTIQFMNSKQMKKWLEQQGTSFQPGKGSHLKVFLNGKQSTLPMHGTAELGKGLETAIKRQLGLK